MRPVGILWQGRSPVDGAPIVAICTDTSKNPKTGPMVQVWIIRADRPPHEAARDGGDASVCGACPLRYQEGKGRACYVTPFQAPLSVYKRFRRGGYGRLSPRDLRGYRVRWGAYGDPAMLPPGMLRAVNRYTDGHSGYTHQWTQPWAQSVRGVLMASVETSKAEQVATVRGWGTFRVLAPGDSTTTGTFCPSAATHGRVTCVQCGKCDGGKRSIHIPAHGRGADLVPADSLTR